MSDHTDDEWRARGARFSESEMAELQCPGQLMGPRHEGRCIGSACAAWRKRSVGVSRPYEDDQAEGFEGTLVTVDIPQGAIIFWCGLGGEPK